MSVSEDLIAQAKAVPIADVVASRLGLRRNGDEFIGLCPFHADGAPSLTVVPRKGFYHCFACSANGDGIKFICEFDKVDFAEGVRRLTGTLPAPVASQRPAAPAPVNRRDRDYKIAMAQKIWGEAQPAAGTPVESYLASRGIVGLALPPSLRFHRALQHPDDKRLYPAMIAAIQGPDNVITGVHRTYLRPDGTGKADVGKARLMLGAGFGGHVRLARRGARLALAEGIETALSVMLAAPGLPVWAVLSLGNFSAPLPDEVREVVFCADHDNSDQAAAERAMRKAAGAFQRQGRRVYMARPPEGQDFNDWVVELRAGDERE